MLLRISRLQVFVFFYWHYSQAFDVVEQAQSGCVNAQLRENCKEKSVATIVGVMHLAEVY